MKVGDLISALSQYDSDLMIIFYREDDMSHELYDFVSLDTTTAEAERFEDGTCYLNHKNMSGSKKLLIELSSDF
ncbi:MAG: hypothetical protein KZQ92_09500 [Candidatus Thiodiazotropha sp. (ex Lucinoma borealis)]|nr:hypothetical protein [Candidatus Thiodiazotropha sp. (ex Lucinoma borealis)]